MSLFSIPDKAMIMDIKNKKNTSINLLAEKTDYAKYTYTSRTRNGKYPTRSLNEHREFLSVYPNRKTVFEKINDLSENLPVRLTINNIDKLKKGMVFIKDSETLLVGEYPQERVDKIMELKLNKYMLLGKLYPTKKSYILGNIWNRNEQRYTFKKVEEYSYQGDKFVPFILNDEVIWFKVSPLVFKACNGTFISEKLVLSNVPFNVEKNNLPIFNKTTLYNFLANCFDYEIIPSYLNLLTKSELNTEEKLIITKYLVNVPKDGVKEAIELIETFGEEYVEVFKSLWVSGDIDRAKFFIEYYNKPKIKVK